MFGPAVWALPEGPVSGSEHCLQHIWKDLPTDDSMTAALMREMGLPGVATAEAGVNNVLTHELGPVFQR
jgi:hypothetical protein